MNTQFQLNEKTLSIVKDIGEHMPGGFFIYKEEQPEELIYANQACFNIFGCRDEKEFKELTGYTFRGMLYKEDYDKISESIVDQIDKNDDNMDYVEYRIVRKDGKLRWVDDYGHYAETEKYGGVYYVFISDITEKHEERERGNEFKEAVIKTLINSYNTVWLINDVETEACSLYHTDMDEIHAEAIRQALSHARYTDTKTEYVNTMVAEEDRARMQEQISIPYMLEQFKTKGQFSVNFLRALENEPRYYRIDLDRVRMPGGRTGVLMGFRDIDEEVREQIAIQNDLNEARIARNQALEEALSAAEQANKAKTAFLSNMSHEIRTPMNAIIGLDDIALNDPDLPDKTREYLEKIGASAQHLLGIINDILDMSRIESGKTIIKNEEFSFAKSLEQVNTIISGQCRDRGISYECHTIGKIDDYYIGDGVKLKQVMINILGNAVKFTPEGGKVAFTIEEGPRFDGKATLIFTISDNGIGMSKEFLPKIFEPFTQEDSSNTSKYGSTGLGMPITKRMIELMNGHIEVDSEKGKGSTFTVTLTFGEAERYSGEQNNGKVDIHSLCVLVVDDDPIAREHAQMVLSQTGISCEMASSGKEAVDMVALHHGRREDFDLILMDLKMPEMDGLETTRKIREIVGEDTPLIVLTSYNWDDVADDAKEAGVDSFLPKPLFAGSIIDEFTEALSRKKESSKPSKAELKGRHVLLAEDMEVNAEIMVMVLKMREIEADVACNGRIAVQLFMDHPEGYYDAILMDMRMPEMDGLEATRAIRASGRSDAKSIPVIALTANAFDEDVQRSLQAGLNAHLSKPVEPDALFDTLETLIRP